MPFDAYSLYPLGDSAVTLDLGPVIDEYHNIRVQAIHRWLQGHRFPGILDVIVAYSSVSVFYDPAVLRSSGVTGKQGPAAWVKGLLLQGWEETGAVGEWRADGAFRPEPAGTGMDGGAGARKDGGAGTGADGGAGARKDGGAASVAGLEGGHCFRIPVCFESAFAPDLEAVARQLGLSERAVIELHCATVYRVYMIGFLPGFPYLGTVDQRLEVPRKQRPVPVAAGGVGIAGRQTGIYPLSSPGGWSIIGRTPIRLFDPEADPPVRLQPGDRVEFYPIPPDEFQQLSGRPE